MSPTNLAPEISADIMSTGVLIIGAGLAGLNCAHRLQTEAPSVPFAILESRNDLGGTWNLFRFPGVRADTDLPTLTFPWHPWPYSEGVAEGHLVQSYLKSAAERFHLRDKILFNHKVISASWSSSASVWHVSFDHQGHRRQLKSQFVVLATGYYDYEKPLKAKLNGIDQFQGRVIHPQFWPNDYEINGKQRVAIIGSGSTAITLFPSLAKVAAKTTLIQRSPSYVFSAAGITQSSSGLAWFMPPSFASALERFYFILVPWILVRLTLWFPRLFRDLVRRGVATALPKRIDQRTHFEPNYNPWEQRLCICPNGSFFQAFHEYDTDIVTGRIKTVLPGHIIMESGDKIAVDVIVTATGLSMKLGGGIDLYVDGEEMDFSKRFIWQGTMLEGIPNLFYMMGYERHSWTLKVDNSAFILCRLVNYMRHHGLQSATPRLPKSRRAGQKTERFWQLSSTYCVRVEDELPLYGTEGPWRHRQHPPLDWLHARYGDVLTGLHLLV